jgi:hypothetical protein
LPIICGVTPHFSASSFRVVAMSQSETETDLP